MRYGRGIICTLVLAAAFAVSVGPLLWMGSTALRDNRDISRDVWAVPTRPTLANVRCVWQSERFGRFFLNSVVITGGAVAVLTLAGALAGYAFGRLDFAGKRLLWLVFMAGLFLPVHVTLVPLNRLEGMLHVSRHAGALVFLGAVYVAFNLSFTVFFLKGFFADVPQELVDAARVDGCGVWGVFWRVLLPLSRPALVVAGLVNAVMIWNEFVFALVLLQSSTFYTLPLAVKNFSDDKAMDLSLTCAALSLTVLPILALFLAAQRRLVEGMIGGALKG